MAKAATPLTFVPSISPDVPWHIRQHIELLYEKLNNHSIAFSHISNMLGGETTSTTIENFGGGGAGTGGGGMIPGLGGVNDQSGNVAYTTEPSDNGVLLVLNDASPVAVNLNSGISSPWLILATNLGAGLVTFTPTSGTINGSATFLLPHNYSTIVVFDGTNWWALAFPVVPQNTPAIPHEWINSYNATTGVFTQTQPSFTDILGQITAAQLPPAGITVTYITGPLTVGGTTGSLTFVDGQLTAQVPAT